MSDSLGAGAATGQGLDLETLVARIEKATPKVWTRLRNALGAKDRAEAIELVQADPAAAKVAINILGVEVAATSSIPPMSTPESGRSRPAGRGQVRF